MAVTWMIPAFAVLCLASYVSATNINCYVCSSEDPKTNATSATPCLDLIPSTMANVVCDGVCMSVKTTTRDSPQLFVRGCLPRVSKNNVCSKLVTEDMTVENCVCDTELCNAVPNFALATTNSTAIKCHNYIEVPAKTRPVDVIVGTLYCSTGSCYDVTADWPENLDDLVNPGNITTRRTRTCSSVPLTTGCTNGFPVELESEAKLAVQSGFNVTKVCACNTDFCNSPESVESNSNYTVTPTTISPTASNATVTLTSSLPKNYTVTPTTTASNATVTLTSSLPNNSTARTGKDNGARASGVTFGFWMIALVLPVLVHLS